MLELKTNKKKNKTWKVGEENRSYEKKKKKDGELEVKDLFKN